MKTIPQLKNVTTFLRDSPGYMNKIPLYCDKCGKTGNKHTIVHDDKCEVAMAYGASKLCCVKDGFVPECITCYNAKVLYQIAERS
jgi:hypothetical protein